MGHGDQGRSPSSFNEQVRHPAHLCYSPVIRIGRNRCWPPSWTVSSISPLPSQHIGSGGPGGRFATRSHTVVVRVLGWGFTVTPLGTPLGTVPQHQVNPATRTLSIHVVRRSDPQHLRRLSGRGHPEQRPGSRDILPYGGALVNNTIYCKGNTTATPPDPMLGESPALQGDSALNGASHRPFHGTPRWLKCLPNVYLIGCASRHSRQNEGLPYLLAESTETA